MSPLVTEALVLHSADYLESSLILRVLTRDAGVQSVVARGARSSRKRFGAAVGLFAQGIAEIQIKSGRDLHTLNSFDVRRTFPELGSSLIRFAACAAVAEVVMLVVHDEPADSVYDVVLQTVNSIAHSAEERVNSEALGGLWRLLCEIGVAPVLGACAYCHGATQDAGTVLFSHSAGGIICESCAVTASAARRLPHTAVETLRAWVSATGTVNCDTATLRSHQRLFREYLGHHVPSNRVLQAYALWERGHLDI